MKSKINTDYLFVYGTLLRNFSLPLFKQIDGDLVLLGTSEIRGELYDLGEYPAALPSNNPNRKVKGEVYLVKHPSEVFKILDEYEGEEYKREKGAIKLHSGETVNAWVYWYKHPIDGKRIKYKSYINYLKNK